MRIANVITLVCRYRYLVRVLCTFGMHTVILYICYVYFMFVTYLSQKNTYVFDFVFYCLFCIIVLILFLFSHCTEIMVQLSNDILFLWSIAKKKGHTCPIEIYIYYIFLLLRLFTSIMANIIAFWFVRRLHGILPNQLHSY